MTIRRRLERLERSPRRAAGVAAAGLAAEEMSAESIAAWFRRDLLGRCRDPFPAIADAREYLGALWDWFGIPETEPDPLNIEISRQARQILHPHLQPNMRGVLP